MGEKQRYVSDELTHFVGGKMKDAEGRHDREGQYSLLVKILSEGWLTHYPHAKKPYAGLTQFTTSTGVAGIDKGRVSEDEKKGGTFHLTTPLSWSAEEFTNCPFICFCDIPAGDFHIHRRKYSDFGVSFQKAYLARRGANPVFYVANNSSVPVLNRSFLEEVAKIKEGKIPQPIPMIPKFSAKDRRQYFSDMKNEIACHLQFCLLILAGIGETGDPGIDSDITKRKTNSLGTAKAYLQYNFPSFPVEHLDEIYSNLIRNWPFREAVVAFTEFLLYHIFGYMKHFTVEKADDDPENYYMEREWRFPGDLNFQLAEVYRVVIPHQFAGRFRADFPSYSGQVDFGE